MAAQSYNFFGLGPAQMQASQDPALLAQQMALQQYNNPTSSQSSGSSSSSGISPQALAKMMMSQNAPGSKGAADAYMNANAVPGSVVTNSNAPLPWLNTSSMPAQLPSLMQVGKLYDGGNY